MGLPRTVAYAQSLDEVFVAFETTATGLTTTHADAHRGQFGSNVIVELKKESALRRYLRQFKDFMIVLLLASAAVTGALGDFGTSAVLVVLVLFNTLIGFVQEYRAEKTMEALEKLVDPISEVYRDGTLGQLESRNLVVGDVVRLSEGSSVPADVRLIATTAFATNDFAMTGESDPTRKHARTLALDIILADRRNMAFAGTTVATGEAYGVVVATGMQTELGRIAQLSQAAPRTRSPLQLEMGNIAKYVTYGVAALSVVVLIIAVQSDLEIKAALLFAVGFACALVPQGLPAEVNTALAAAAGALAKQNALVKKLSSVETLGATHVICTDKTGTLTKNEMTVTEIYVAGVEYRVTGIGYAPAGAIEPTATGKTLARLQHFLTVGVLASNARLVAPDATHPDWWILGDPTEGSLLVAAQKSGLDLDKVLASAEEVDEVPFDSTRKLMTSIRKDASGALRAYVKGAPESIIECASHIDDGTTVRPITAADRDAFLAVHTEKASRAALRNLAFATRDLTAADAATSDQAVIEKDLTVLGMISMMDPIRSEVPDAMRTVLAAGVRVSIITGDFSLTAGAIARQAGLIGADGLVIVTGTELATLSDAEVLAHALSGGVVFSRVAPEDKVRIVDLVRESGQIVAVTGDGINDAPALRHASIGVAMGVSGTDVAKQASEIVLLDDSFATLVGAVRQGRTIYANIRKGVLSCLTSNAAELTVNSFSLALASLFGVPLALNVMQILAIDLLGEIFPIAALGRDREEGETMKQDPRDPRARILNGRSVLDILWAGFLIGGLAIANYLLFYGRAGVDPFTETVAADVLARAMAMTYVTIMACQFVSIVQRRSMRGFFTRYQFNNRTFWLAMALGAGIVLVIVYVPFVAGFFGTGPLALLDWGYVLAAAVVFLAIREGGRALRQKLRGSAAIRRAPAARPVRQSAP